MLSFKNRQINGFRENQPMGEAVTWELQKIVYRGSIVEVSKIYLFAIIQSTKVINCNFKINRFRRLWNGNTKFQRTRQILLTHVTTSLGRPRYLHSNQLQQLTSAQVEL